MKRLLAGALFIACSLAGAGQPRANPEQGEREMSESVRRPVVILGASYARGWQPESIAGLPVINRGVSGEQSFEMLARFSDDVVAHRPRAVILWGYINDFFRGERAKADETMERAKESFRAMVTLARENGIEPVVATEVTIRGEDSWTETVAGWIGGLLGKESYQDYINGKVREANEWLRDYAEREGLLLLDLEPVLADARGRRRKEFAKEDGSHITPAGYEAIQGFAAPVLEDRLGGR